MKKTLSLTGLALSVMLASGCSTTLIGFSERADKIEGVYSRQVAFMPYSTQGVDVAPSQGWYYGNTQGIKAYAAEGGIVYVNDSGTWEGHEDQKGADKKGHSSDANDANQGGAVLADAGNTGAGLGGAGASDGSKLDSASNKLNENNKLNTGDSKPKDANKLSSSNSADNLDGNGSGLSGASSSAENNQEAATKNSAQIDGKQKKAGGLFKTSRYKKYFDSHMIHGELALSVSFKFNKSEELYSESNDELNNFISEYRPDEHRIVLIGYTDDVGLDDYNIPFSLKRAEFIQSKIMAAHPKSEVTTIGSGPSPRMVDNRFNDGRKTNRRVEIYLVKKG